MTPPGRRSQCRTALRGEPISSMRRSPATRTYLHNFIPNLVVTEDGRIGSIDSRVLTAHKVHGYGAVFQTFLAEKLRNLGVRIGYDEQAQAAVALDIPEEAVNLFSKRDRQVIGDA